MRHYVVLGVFAIALCCVNCEDAVQQPTQNLQNMFDSFTKSFQNFTGTLAQNMGVDPSTVQNAQTQFEKLKESAGKIQQQLLSQNATAKLLEVFQDMTTKTNSTLQDLKNGKGEDVVKKWADDTSKNFQVAIEQAQQQASKVLGNVKLPTNGTSFLEDGFKKMQEGLESLTKNTGA